MDCEDLNKPFLLPDYFAHIDESTLKMLFECLYKSHYRVFIGVGRKMTKSYSYPEFKKEDLIHDAFIDALVALYNKLKKNGWEDKGVALGAAFLVFYQFTVRKLLKELGRRDDNDRGYFNFINKD